MTDTIKIDASDFSRLAERLKIVKDSVKRKELISILRSVALDTKKAAIAEAPKSKKKHTIGRGSRKKTINPGATKRGIRILTMTRSKEPMVIVSPKGTAQEDTFYARQFVIPGHFVRKPTSKSRTNRRLRKLGSGTKTQPDNFMERARNITENSVSQKTKDRIERLIDRKLARL